ncbi:glycosyltransferase family 4 protein [Saccharicrinis sp. FJH54]|uniref:glycosyltransferase family 4 protein n=1 Tax=Saccharicrinis sp. FJH54 TaxID=3344665 RepID=UPI0035D43DFC
MQIKLIFTIYTIIWDNYKMFINELLLLREIYMLMKVLMVLESEFPPDVRVENEINALSQAGHEIHIACITLKGQDELIKKSNYTIHRKRISKFIHKSSVGALKFSFYFRFWGKYLRGILVKQKFDVIHIHDLPLVKVGVTLKSEFKLKLITDLHENWPALLSLSEHTKKPLGRLLCSIPQWKAYEKYYLQFPDHIIVVIDEAKNRLKKLGISDEKISVVSNTLNTDLFDFPPLNADKDRFTMIYGGGVNYHRGLQTVIRAIPELVKQINNLEVWIIGSGRYLDTLKEMAQQEGIEKNVIFWGWMPQKELLIKMNQSNVALIPHLKTEHTDNTIPHKLFQYMFAGIPIISSNCDPLVRIIQETKSGLIFEDGNTSDFCSQVMKIYTKSVNFDHKLAKEKIITKYNWENDSRTLTGIYQTI